ncbi:MAG: hypothetical protein O3A00_10065 [Planctomycetota bacterium]|nr:hypothetical protein [Planctomycetota bacterium]
MRRFGILFTIMVFSISASVAVGQFGGGFSAKAGQKAGPGGKGKVGFEGKGNGPNPADMAKRMIQNFDQSGDGALNLQELTVAFTAMRQMRAQGGQKGRGPEGKGGFGGPQGKGGPKGKGDAGKSGRPKRPQQ